jgi:glycerophosphoryl diester phosphodiesterase
LNKAAELGSARQHGVSIEYRGRAVLLKWHKLRRGPDEPPFSLANLRAGLALGASLEIDIRLLADGAWVCLHDDMLDEETDGSGPVAGVSSDAIRRLRIAGSDYPPPLLAHVASVVAAARASKACLQIDLKEPAGALTRRAIRGFAETIAPIAPTCLLSGTEWTAVERLGAGVPRLRLGYDPYDVAEGRRLDDGDSIAAFVDEVFATAPAAHTFYLYHRFVGAALAHGVDPIAILKSAAAKIDVWTLDPTMPEIETMLPRMVAAGADQITTNDPIGMARLWEALNSRARSS